MAKITICGNAVVITSALKLEDMRMVKKYRPDALVLKGGEDGKEPIYAIGVSEYGEGSIDKNGAIFTSKSHDGGGFATITTIFQNTEDDIKTVVLDMFGGNIVNLNKIEATIPSVIEEIRAERNAVRESISVAQ